MSSLMKRILSALVMAPVATAAIWFGGIPFYILIGLCFVISLMEWSKLSMRDGKISTRMLGGGILYLGCAFVSCIWLREFESAGFYILLYVFFAVWACDVGAYTAGRLIGGPKMAPTVSPNKTWAGLFGGCVAAVAAVMLYDMWLDHHEVDSAVIKHFSLFFQFILGLFLAVVGQLGDLSISVLKRKVGLKDTGNIIPGHGGLLDRIDALLLTLPTYAIVVRYLDYLLSR